MAQGRLNAAEAILPPHGTATIHDGHDHFPVLFLQNLTESVAQFTGELQIKFSGSIVHLDIPLLAAAIGAITGDTAECIKIRRFYDFHKFSLTIM